MSLFLGYVDYKGRIDQRKDKIIKYIIDYFDPQQYDTFYFMDPYIDIVNSIQDPISDNELDRMFWSSLISNLEIDDVEINIITTMELDGLKKLNNDPPFFVPYENDTAKMKIWVSKYIDAKYFDGYSLHDRYIIKKNGSIIKGLHIGPSMDATDNKDVSITIYNSEAAELAYNNFKVIWDECKKTKGWRKG